MSAIQKQSELAFLGVRALTRFFRDGEITPVDAANAAFEQIAARNDSLNAFSHLDHEGALQAAAASAARWRVGRPLSAIDGITTTIKDVMMVEGWPTTFGSRVLGSGEPSTWNSPAVDRLLEAGAVLVGQTTTPESGWKGVTDNTIHGVTRNPWDTNKTPGGSSGGAAAAAAAGMGVLHVGTDGGGSIRMPAAFTGTFGHKPSFGRVPAYPPSPYSTLAHVGPMTRSVEDAAIMLSVLTGADVRDWHALPPDGVRYEEELTKGVKGKRIAYSPDLGYVDVDPEIASVVRKAADQLADLGANVEEVGHIFDEPVDIVEALYFTGLAARFGDMDSSKLALVDPGLIEIIEKGKKVLLRDFLDASVARAEFGRKLKQFFVNYDLLLTPTVPIAAFDVELQTPETNGRGWSHAWIPFTYPFNLTQQPACSVPCGFTSEGLPVGLQIVGRMYDDKGVLQAAHAFEAICPPTFPINLKMDA
ncbi:MAG: amidase [Pseudomonadota bacterium]